MTDQRVGTLGQGKSTSRYRHSVSIISRELYDSRREYSRTSRKLFDPTSDPVPKTTKSDDSEDYKRNTVSKPNNRRLFDPECDPVIPKSKHLMTGNSSFESENKIVGHQAALRTREELSGQSKSVAEKSSSRRKSRNLVDEDVARAHCSQSRGDSSNTLKGEKVSRQDATSNAIKLLLEDVYQLESQIAEDDLHFNSYLKNGKVFKDETYWGEKVDLHIRLSKKYAQYIHLHYSLAMKNEIEAKCWKICYYSLIEKFRQAIKMKKSDSSIILSTLYDFLDKAEEFYKLLIIQMDKDSENVGDKSKTPRWFRCVDCLGDISRYRWSYSVDDLEVSRDSLADIASNWYLMGIKLNPTNGKFYHHLAILAPKNELRILYYYCRSLMVKMPFLTARESLVLFFERNRKRFTSHESSPTKAKGESMRSHSNSTTFSLSEPAEHQTFLGLFVRLHGMLFTKIGLEHFEEIEKAFLLRVCTDNDEGSPTESRSCDFFLKMAIINLSSFYDYGSKEASSFKRALRSLDDTGNNYTQTVAADFAFSQVSRLTFKLMYNFMLKYTSSDANSGPNPIMEGWILYIEIVLLWMVASGVFKTNAEDVRKSVWDLIISNSIPSGFWSVLARFLTHVAEEVGLTNEIVADLLDERNSASKFLLRNPVLPEDWELRGIVWLERVYSPKLSEDYTKSLIRSIENQDAQLLSESVKTQYASWLNQDVVKSRRYRIFELGIILSEKRRLELEALLAATRNNSSGKVASNSRLRRQKSSRKNATTSRIRPGITCLVIDTNCFIGDLRMMKEIIQCEKWTVIVPLVVITELDGLSHNPPPLGSASAEAITYIEQTLLAKRYRKLKIQTSKGNYVSDINFKEMFDFGEGENKRKNLDDLILGICCWHISNQNSSTRQTRNDSDLNNSATVVLLTNDRNLRIKARARGIDVAVMQDFKKLLGR
ncbi:8390_t:CDS:2 [Paraglomus occultum]|uniref:8390_t:CDS:1 n=1 Tax=Paraglomus occultum TaxID=144539 RepID=A0A9N8ZTL1_9GLOM|nr:8390_t:CDS:2 [Paraglomus occultum]